MTTITRVAHCEVHGDYNEEGWDLGISNPIWRGCPTCSAGRDEKHRREEAERQQREAESRTRQRISEARIPLRFAQKTLANYRTESAGQRHALTEVHKYIGTFPDVLKDGRSLVMLGNVGTGKTHLTCAALHELANRGYRTRYTTTTELIRMIRDTWNKRTDRTESEVIRLLTSVDLLAIDEVGVQLGSDSEKAQLTELFDARYRAMKPTVVISNLDKQGLERVLGERVVDRLREGGIVIPFDWESARGGMS